MPLEPVQKMLVDHSDFSVLLVDEYLHGIVSFSDRLSLLMAILWQEGRPEPITNYRAE